MVSTAGFPFRAVALTIATFAPALSSTVAPQVQTLRPVDALSAEVCGQFLDPISFVQTSTGHYLILDRRAHTVFSVDANGRRASRLVQVGLKQGELLQPGVLSLAADDTFAVADAPFGQERIQIFFDSGTRRDAFVRQGTLAPRLTIGSLIVNGAGTLDYNGQTMLINTPDAGSLLSELDLTGNIIRRIGLLRPTGHEQDPQVHLGLNLGLPLSTVDGGILFVFQTGIPLVRKYGRDGHVEYERHIEGPELDTYIQGLPTTWPTRQVGDGSYPLIPPIIRTATIAPTGELWISLMTGVTYVYNTVGDKVRTVRFEGAEPISPTSLSFSQFGDATRLLVLPGCYLFDGQTPEAAP